ncbi:response regulator transcription factor [Glaciihabitans arcticus]|uniref:Response regulator transcription factor n=1 Tax=Glaciihabitans arcticus TaxID=2668039 RepID=A0A4Q9GR65_9MICO|nr:response regulator [Glaciihabitans arcticus]TBN57141.1 response regulator transcription factor [Glaciihabitans arcticus]
MSEQAGRQLRVVVADDDAFTISLVAGGLSAKGFGVATATTTEGAWQLVDSTEPHALVSDLNFGPGESGVALLRRVRAEYPWIGIVVLTSHASPELAVDDAADLPTGVVYLVKSKLAGIDDLASAVMLSISGDDDGASPRGMTTGGTILVTAAQADVLRLLAHGASTRAVAEHRGTTTRAAETMLARLYTSLGVADDERSNPRVAAVQLWQQGRVSVK